MKYLSHEVVLHRNVLVAGLEPGERRIDREDADELDGVVERQSAFIDVVQLHDDGLRSGRFEDSVTADSPVHMLGSRPALKQIQNERKDKIIEALGELVR